MAWLPNFSSWRAALKAWILLKTNARKAEWLWLSFLPEKDRIFTPIVLNDDEQQLFADMKQRILPQYAEPDVVIYLQTAVENNRKRLQKRHEGIISLFPELFGTGAWRIQPFLPFVSKRAFADCQCRWVGFGRQWRPLPAFIARIGRFSRYAQLFEFKRKINAG